MGGIVKKLAIGIVVLVGLLLATIIIAPFVVDVDKFRPDIVKLANEKINGNLNIGKLRLSLWGKVEIQVDGLSVKDAQGSELVKVGEAFVHLPFSSLLSGSPHLILRLSKPNINVVMNKAGEINLLGLAKKSDADPTAKQPEQPAAGKEAPKAEGPRSETEQKIIDMINQAKVDFKLEGANFSFVDMKGGLDQKVTDFNLILTDISLTKTIGLELFTNIKTKMGKTLSVVGPFRIDGKITPTFNEFDFKKVLIAMTLSFDDIEFDLPGTFKKPKGKPTNIKLEVEASPNDIDLRNLEIRFLEVVAVAKAKLNNLAKPPERLQFDMKADYPGVDLNLSVNLVSFAKPNARVDLSSKGIDLDVLFPPPPGGRKPLVDPNAPASKKAEPESGKSTPSSKAPAPEEPPTDVDGSLDDLRKNEFLKGLDAALKLRIAFVRGFELNIENIALDTSFRNLVAGLDRFDLNIFGGSLKTKANIDLKPRAPVYRFDAEVSKWDLNKAVASQLAFIANTIKGLLSFKAGGGGQSLNSDKMMRNSDVKGDFKFEEATFASMDIGKMANEAVAKLADKAKKKIPGLGDYAVKSLPDKKGRYKFIGSDFSLKNGTFSAPNFKAVSYEKEGLDVIGTTSVGLIDDSISATWGLVDTYHQTGLFDVGVNKEILKRKIQVDHIFSEGGAPVKFPVTVGCKLSEPCVKYDSVATYLVGVAVKNVTGQTNSLLDAEKAKLKAKLDEAKRKAQERVDAEKRKAQARIDAEKKKQQDRLNKKKQEAQAKADAEKNKAKEKAKKEGSEKAKKALKKFGF